MRASVVACRDASPILELREHVFHLVAFPPCGASCRSVHGKGFAPCGSSWGDAGGNAPIRQQFPDLIAVVAPIRDQGCRAGQVGQKHIRALEVAAGPAVRYSRTGRPSPSPRACGFEFIPPPGRARSGVDHTRTAGGLPRDPGRARSGVDHTPFARREAARWAFRWVASIINTSRAGCDGLAGSSSIRARMPFPDQRTKRLWGVL